jgi:hypothetical protein
MAVVENHLTAMLVIIELAIKIELVIKIRLGIKIRSILTTVGMSTSM